MIILTVKICLLLFSGQAADSQSSEGLAAGGTAEETRDVDLEVPWPRLFAGEPSGRESERGRPQGRLGGVWEREEGHHQPGHLLRGHDERKTGHVQHRPKSDSGKAHRLLPGVWDLLPSSNPKSNPMTWLWLNYMGCRALLVNFKFMVLCRYMFVWTVSFA